MKRHQALWLFGICACALLSVMAWLTSTIRDLDRAQRQARDRAALEENVRLALWRMESLLGPLIAQQNAAHRSFYDGASAAESSAVLASPYVRLHFQLDARNRLTTPRRDAPADADIRMLERRTSHDALLARLRMDWTQIEPARPAVIRQADAISSTGPQAQTVESSELQSLLKTAEQASDQDRLQRLAELNDASKDQTQQTETQNDSMRQAALNRQEFNARSLFALSNAGPIVEAQQAAQKKKKKENRPARSASPEVESGTREVVTVRTPEPTPEPERIQQTEVSAAENEPRETATRIDSMRQAALAPPDLTPRPQSIAPSDAPIIQEQRPPPKKPKARRLVRSASPEIRVGVMEPVWLNDVLVLARRVRVGKQELVQGCWLDWPKLEAWLLDSIRDLLPEARLNPVRGGENDPARSLAALPIRLEPGRIAVPLAAAPSTLRLPLRAAWASAIVSLLAVGALLWGVASLGERRAAFVSAVTHELRTPLTTFRMYAEMLAEGMVQSEEQKQAYLETLQREAERQTHLVENVLAYARLERGHHGGARETLTVSSLLRETIDTLRRHAEQCGMTLADSIEPECAAARVAVDASAVERILFNLVDNACKYAHDADDRRIHVNGRCSKGVVSLTVSDHGPGLGAKESRRLFQPFRKSARDAANSSPGVGLGLALSRRLARAMGGDLRFMRSKERGAAFSLSLKALE